MNLKVLLSQNALGELAMCLGTWRALVLLETSVFLLFLSRAHLCFICDYKAFLKMQIEMEDPSP